MTTTSSKILVEVEPRTERGKNACRRIRASGKVPANVHGLKLDPFSVAVSPKRIEEVLRLGSGRNTILTLSLGGESTRAAMIRELQRDPVTESMLHIDFIRVDLEKSLHVRVPIRLHGLPEGVKNEGGVLDFVHREVEVECLPDSIPEHLDLDVSGLHLNQHLAVSDLQPGAGVRILAPPDTIVAVVVPPKAEEAPAEAVEEVAAAAEPEVIKGKGKEAETPPEGTAKEK